MKTFVAISSLTTLALTVALAGAFVFSYPPGACACGEVTEAHAAWYWDEMTTFERARYRLTGTHPFDPATGERL